MLHFDLTAQITKTYKKFQARGKGPEIYSFHPYSNLFVAAEYSNTKVLTNSRPEVKVLRYILSKSFNRCLEHPSFY